jgi:putative ABC transport system permease protein
MKLARLIFKNALRNRLRAVLTIGGSAFLMWVLIFIMTAMTEMEAWEGESAGKLRVAVQHSTGLATPLPYSLEDFLKREPVTRHASHVAKLNWFQGVYKDPKNWFARFAVDHEVIREVWDEFKMPDDQYKAFGDTRNGCIAGKALAEKFGWKIGERIPIKGDIYPCDLDLVLVGIYAGKNAREEQQLYFQWKYMNELLNDSKPVGTFWLRARTLEDLPKLKEIIDAHTKNSSDPTESMTEKEFGAQFTAMMGNYKALIAGLGTIVLIIMILMTANTMAMVARERVTEIAVLRTLGFPALSILVMILGEALVLTMSGGALALAGSVLLFNVGQKSPVPDFFPTFIVEPVTIGVAVGASFACGILSALIPAVRAATRKIVDGLRQVV